MMQKVPRNYFITWKIPLLKVLADMELEGINLDKDFLRKPFK